MTHNTRLLWVNLIAGLTSDGEVLYTVNVGKTNSYTFGFFLTKLTPGRTVEEVDCDYARQCQLP